MSVAIEDQDKPCIVLETLACELPDAAIDYECCGKGHRFSVARAGLEFSLQMPDHVLSRKGLRELEEVAIRTARQVRDYCARQSSAA